MAQHKTPKIFLGGKEKKGYYGNGFIIKKSREDEINSLWKVDERICVLKMNTKDNNTISIINVYGPTSILTEKKPEIRDTFYEKLEDTLKKEEKTSKMVIIAGDFNSKVGARIKEDICVGNFSKGRRNQNGEALISFCEANSLFIMNSRFQHPARHQTTWQGQFKRDNKIIPVYNQIDFILGKKKDMQLFQQARSYAGTTVTTDHRLVKSKISLEWWKMKREKTNRSPNIDTKRLVENKETRENYQKEVKSRIDKELTDETKSAQEKWENLQNIIKGAALETVGETKPTKKTNRTYDRELAEKSKEQKKLRLDIQSSRDEEQKKQLKKERGKLKREINKRAKEIRDEEIDKQVDEIEGAPSSSRMFKAVGTLLRGRYENPKIEDQEGKLVTEPNKMLKLTTDHFKEKFNKEGAKNVEAHSGEARPLNSPITEEEVRNSFKKLNNNRATGEDGIAGELLKHGPPKLAEKIAKVFNQAFEKHQPLHINKGNMITLQKPGKPKGPIKNLRPVTLLNTARKALSLITLNRIRDKVENYLSKNQSGFRPFRSTADVVWTHRWLAAKTALQNIEIKITGIDMSSAFDTINREILINILKEILEEDELRLVQFLLSNTEISIQVKGATDQLPFQANVGTPQGDSLSPVLFIVYLEAALKEIRELPDNDVHPALQDHNYNKEKHQGLPREIEYADDVDFINIVKHKNDKAVQTILAKYHLLVNEEKTEKTNIKREKKKRMKPGGRQKK